MDAETFRDLVAAGDEASRADALHGARSLTFSDVSELLDYDFLDEHSEQVSQFLQEWLRQLPVYQRAEAADWVASQYLLGLVHLEHSWGTAARLLLEVYTAVAEQLATDLEGFRPLTEGPDAEAPTGVADRLDGLAATLHGVRESLLSEIDALSGKEPGDG
ncbi:hypothetical protein EQW78_13635 [Oerskovia turbata]|uniref:Uncharacterized protein n=1 Tax=Oerskovia turbata TaxID=1713 RepID=A0A4Q1KRS3_9CELL|nr:hypothetical protein [Oerskovia turbata]RXR25288.1 hypothetical protein EQW73_10550 [Oerskovia turbata]RXR32771.1 hypothetical protein EQW78_13635 [Oerskovia turbata]TGJ95550.1 hypothetical protein DLJ96_13505 [Actinotalea fermentans ATCC 43279 = JCM 9966 = DSM 3133]